MSLASGAVDLYMTYKFLRILTQSFEDTDAFNLGIIDKDGNILRKRNTLRKPEEKKAYSIFHRLIWKLKRILGKLPLGKTRLASYAAALWFVKEQAERDGMVDTKKLETSFYSHLKENNALPDFKEINERFATLMNEANLKKGVYKLKLSLPDAGVIDTDAGADMAVGDIIIVKKDTEPIDTVLGVEIYRAFHKETGKEVIVSQDDLFKVN